MEMSKLIRKKILSKKINNEKWKKIKSYKKKTNEIYRTTLNYIEHRKKNKFLFLAIWIDECVCEFFLFIFFCSVYDIFAAPPDILDYPTSTDMVVKEGSNVTLKCSATGSPPPTITFRREDGDPIKLPGGTEGM